MSIKFNIISSLTNMSVLKKLGHILNKYYNFNSPNKYSNRTSYKQKDIGKIGPLYFLYLAPPFCV